MKTNDIILIGALGLGGYFLSRGVMDFTGDLKQSIMDLNPFSGRDQEPHQGIVSTISPNLIKPLIPDVTNLNPWNLPSPLPVPQIQTSPTDPTSWYNWITNPISLGMGLGSSAGNYLMSLVGSKGMESKKETVSAPQTIKPLFSDDATKKLRVGIAELEKTKADKREESRSSNASSTSGAGGSSSSSPKISYDKTNYKSAGSSLGWDMSKYS